MMDKDKIFKICLTLASNTNNLLLARSWSLKNNNRQFKDSQQWDSVNLSLLKPTWHAIKTSNWLQICFSTDSLMAILKCKSLSKVEEIMGAIMAETMAETNKVDRVIITMMMTISSTEKFDKKNNKN